MSYQDTAIEQRQMNVATRRNRIHPYKMLLYVGCGSLMMMFIALTSAYVVRRAGGNWLEFSIPAIFYVNTAVILASSVTLQLAYNAFKRESDREYKGLLSVSFVLGLAFLILQYVGWNDLASMGVPLRLNPSGDFIYAISGLHALHVVGGVAALAVSLLLAYLLKLRRTPARQLRLELVLVYWHFVDVLWLYLIIFLSAQR